jgi:diacylglycerol kinase (ATP)
MARACGILNPASGGSTGSRPDEIAALLTRAGCRQIQFTAPEISAEELARRAVHEGYDLLVVAGGDGTVHQVVNGLAPHFDRAAIALIPLGTGNDFSRSLAMPIEPDEAVRRILEGKPRPTDVLRASGGDGVVRYVINHSTAGFSAVAAQHANAGRKSSLGPLEYLRSAAAAISDSQAYRVKVSFDEAPPPEAMELYNIIIANGRTVGGGIPIAPAAALDDGQMDVIIVPAASLQKLATIVPHILNGKHLDHPDVIFRRARSLQIEGASDLPFTLDGELHDCCVDRFEVLERVLRVVC